MASTKHVFSLVSILLYFNHGCFGVTNKLNLLYHPEKKQKVALLYDVHHEMYETIEKKEYKKVIKQHVNELTRLVKKLSKQKRMTLMLAESHAAEASYYEKEYKRSYITILALLQYFMKKGYSLSGNLAFQHADPRTWTEYILSDYCHFCLSTLRNRKATLDENVQQALDEEYLSCSMYLYHLKSQYKRMINTIDSLDGPLPFKENLHRLITDGYNHIIEVFENNKEKAQQQGDSFHHVLEIELKNNNERIFMDISWLSLVPFDIELMYRISKSGVATIVVQCGAAHAEFLEFFLLQAGYRTYEKHGIELTPIVKEQDDYYMLDYVSDGFSFYLHELPIGLDRKIMDFFYNPFIRLPKTVAESKDEYKEITRYEINK